MRQGPEHSRPNLARRAGAFDAGNATAFPLMVCVTALVVAFLILGAVVTGLGHPGGASAPSWSGAEGPPGAVGLSPEQSVLRTDHHSH